MTSKSALGARARASRARRVERWRVSLKWTAYLLLAAGVITLAVVASKLVADPLTPETVEWLRGAVSLVIAGLILGALVHWEA